MSEILLPMRKYIIQYPEENPAGIADAADGDDLLQKVKT